MTTAQQRSTLGIGASEIAAANGISRYDSRYGLWLRKTGRADEFAGNVHTRLGNLCEPRIRQLYADATGEDVEIPPCSVFHPTVPWARCTPDGRWVSNRRRKVQIKCTGYFVGRKWKYEIPLEIVAQVQWEMFVDDGDACDIAVLVGSDELEWERFVLGHPVDPAEIFARATLEIFTVYRSDADIAILLDGARAFWALVESDTQPPIDGSPECREHLNSKPGGSIVLDYEPHAAEVEEFRLAYVGGKAAEKRLETAKNRIREILGIAEADRISTPAGPIVWTANKQLRAPEAWTKEI